MNWTPGLGNAPVLADSVANFQCRAANRYYGGDHIIFLGAVEAYAYNHREPLLFARGSFGQFIADDGNKSSVIELLNSSLDVWRFDAIASVNQRYFFPISARYQSPISLAVISATPSWLMT